MKSPTYLSVLKDEMSDFVELRSHQGFKDKNRYILKTLDNHLISLNVTEKELTSPVVESWLLESCGDVKARTANNYTAYYNAFAKYLITIGIPVFVAEPPILDQSYIPYIFSAQQIEDIFRNADNRTMNDRLTRIQFPMLLRILYGCGLRLGEALSLRLSDFDAKNGVLYIWKGKRNKDRLVPMDKTLIKILSNYCDVMLSEKSPETYLFESNFKDKLRDCIGKPRSHAWAQSNFIRVLEDIGIEILRHSKKERSICLHCLRHTFAVNSFQNQEHCGIDNYRKAPLLSIYLGHLGLEGTQKYLHMTDAIAADIIDQAAEYSKELFPEVPEN